MKLSDLKLKAVPFKDFYHEEFPKKQIYLHHTAGGPDGENVFSYWDRNNPKVATCVAISKDGTIVQGFSSKFWAYHLGLETKTFTSKGLTFQSLDKISIGIEICSYGSLKKSGKDFKSWAGNIVDPKNVITLDEPFRGSKYYEKYTQAQIDSTLDLIEYWSEIYGIDPTFRYDIFEISERALKGEGGVFTHNSVRADKSDIYPDPDLIDAWIKRFAKTKK